MSSQKKSGAQKALGGGVILITYFCSMPLKGDEGYRLFRKCSNSKQNPACSRDISVGQMVCKSFAYDC